MISLLTAEKYCTVKIELKEVNKKRLKKMVSEDFFICKMYDHEKYFSMLPLNVSFKIERLDRGLRVVKHAHHGYWVRFTKN